MTEERFVTIRQAAKSTGVSEYCLRQMYHKGELPGYSNPDGTKYHVNLQALREKLREENPNGVEVLKKGNRLIKVRNLEHDGFELYRSIDKSGFPKSHIFVVGEELFTFPYEWEDKMIEMITGNW